MKRGEMSFETIIYALLVLLLIGAAGLLLKLILSKFL